MGLFQRFRRNDRGVAALEFAIVAPMILILYMGASQLSIGVTLDRKLQNIAATTTDLVSQSQGGTTTKGEISAILKIARAMVEPYDSADVKIRLMSVSVDAKGKATVDWTPVTAGGATAPKKGDVYALPAAFSAQRSRSFVIAEVEYTYKPLGGFGLQNALPLKEASYQTPRTTDPSSGIVCSDC
ncbi:TadE/TadG family type IV pilus assembly protein [Aureimonas sp. ME7]|uniref:TadE/TadG family type IV pilus assembly protein n=1 Tax=Aureimonas sp. ME7 TaxID=2744252 RepID=UPI0015F60237|nr:TadE/TadG family type IV pilus assembly protein [Aureimonas sp. ME7]